MNHLFRKDRWSPYLVGTGIGMLSWITFAWMNKALGVSTTMVRATGAMERVVAKSHVESNAYFVKYLGTVAEPKPVFEWQFALVIMLFFGALLAAKLAGSKFEEQVPRLWAWRFGPSKWIRYIGAFLGGVILLFGARLAGGCTSGHAISGALQLAVSSWAFFIAMIVGGAITAFILFGKGGRDHV